MKRPFRYALPLVALALFGFGCKKPLIDASGAIPSANNNPAAQTVAVFTPEIRHDITTSRDFSREIGTIRQGLANLGQASSFHATLTLPSPSGQIEADLDFSRSQGMRGRIAMPGTSGTLSAEIYLNGDQILFKDGLKPWQDITKTDQGAKLAGVLKQAFAFDQAHPVPISIMDSAFIQSQSLDPSGCTLYDVIQSSAQGEVQTYRACVAGDMTTGLDIDTASGLVRIRYTNINSDIKIEKPQL